MYTLGLLLLTGSLTAQITFQKAGSKYTEGFRSGVAVVCTDMNGDTYDDLVRLNFATEVEVDLQGQEGSLFVKKHASLAGGGSWNAVAGDVNNDGWVDIVTSGAFDKVKVLYHTPFQQDYEIQSLDGPNFFAQGANLVDIDNDGFLDIFVCDDNATSDIYMNDGTGAFNVVDTIIDFTTDPPSDNSGNYGSVWNDFDNDGDLDLYIAKCRQGVGDPADPRRINALFVNMGDTAYVEMADSFGIASGWQSWSPDFGDIDNDGDLDLFITNHDGPSQLFENIDGTRFEDISAGSGIVVFGLAIQSCFHDFDNDGLLDLLISGTNSFLYRNIGNNQFIAVNDPFQGRDITSYALGDLNADGFMDVYATYNELFNSPSDAFDDAIWMQDPNDNHYLRVHLVGTTCNRNAVGARITVYGEWGLQMREVQAGESYGITNSLVQMFGLGTADGIDSLLVRWPNGVEEMHYNVPSNTTVTIEEGGCLTSALDLAQGPFTQCGTDTFEISAPDGYAGYVWSNGLVSQSIAVVEPGIYHVSLTDDQGCTTISGPVEVRADETATDSLITLTGRDELCVGDTAILSAPEGNAYTWNTGETTQDIVVTSSGEYTVAVERGCGVLTTPLVSVTVFDPAGFATTGDTIMGSGTGTLQAEGDSILWYDAADAAKPLGSGNMFITPVVDTNTLFYAQNVVSIPGFSGTVGMKEHAGGTMYNGDQFNGHLEFDVLSDVVLDSVLVMTEFPGERAIVITNGLGEQVFWDIYMIDSGSHYLAIEVLLPAGEGYTIGTDEEFNNTMFGTNSPKLVRSDGGVVFPYVLDNVLSINSTQFGIEFYYYFFDWHVTTEDTYCVSPRVEVELVVTDSTTQVRYLPVGSIAVYPNPARGSLFVITDALDGDLDYDIHALDGRRLQSGVMHKGTPIDISGLARGMYIVELRSGGMAVVGKFVVE